MRMQNTVDSAQQFQGRCDAATSDTNPAIVVPTLIPDCRPTHATALEPGDVNNANEDEEESIDPFTQFYIYVVHDFS